MALDQINNSKLIWLIGGGLIIIVALGAAYFWLSSNSEPEVQQVAIPAPKPKVEAPPVVEPVMEQPASEAVDENALVKEDILKEQVPENASLAKEEIARLDDIQKQLNEQENSLKGQHVDADKLIQLKEEQIKLIEQQIAAKSS